MTSPFATCDMRITFEKWLRSLESDPDLLVLEAKTSHEVDRYKTALRRWREAGYPNPERVPEQWRQNVSAYTNEWIDEWAEKK